MGPRPRRSALIGSQVQLRPELAKLRCVEDVEGALEQDIACAAAFNRASWERAYTEAGLEPLDLPEAWDQGYYPSTELGQPFTDPDNPERRLVYLGAMGDWDCSGVYLHTPTSPGVKLARNANGELVAVIPAPELEARNYVRCSCNPGCGAERAPQFRFVELPAEASFAGVAELRYAAISISSADAESCCCAP